MVRRFDLVRIREPDLSALDQATHKAFDFELDFESASPWVIKSIRQRNLLNTWLRLYARDLRLPRIEQYLPERLAEELPDLVYYTVDMACEPPRLTIQSDGTRLSSAYGHNGGGRLLDQFLGPHLAPVVMPVYYKCLVCALPVYTIADVEDTCGRLVAYERLLMPFADKDVVTHAIASIKTISEDGGFEIRNLMRANDKLPQPRLRAVIDRDLSPRTVRLSAGDIIEFG